MTPEEKAKIDAMTQKEMAHMWRFAPFGDPLMTGDTGQYFIQVFKDKGFFTPAISKQLGWEE